MIINRVSTSMDGVETGQLAVGLEDGRKNRMVDERTLRNIEARLSRIEGQVRGIRNMNTEGRLCLDIVTQIAAVRAALKKVADLMVGDFVEQWLKEASSSTSSHGSQDLEDLLRIFNQYYR